MITDLSARRIIELNLSHVKSVLVYQTVVRRILGFGFVVIIGTSGTHETLIDFRKPDEIRKKTQEKLQHEHKP
jgi:hypothetical protein